MPPKNRVRNPATRASALSRLAGLANRLGFMAQRGKERLRIKSEAEKLRRQIYMATVEEASVPQARQPFGPAGRPANMRAQGLQSHLEAEERMIGEIFWPRTGMKSEEKKQLVQGLMQMVLEHKITNYDQLQRATQAMIRQAEEAAAAGNAEAAQQAEALRKFSQNIGKLDYYQKKKLAESMARLSHAREKFM